MTAGADNLRRVGEVLLAQGGGEAVADGGVGAARLGAAAQDDRVARLERQRRRVGGDIGARFVDDEDDAERHAHFADADAGRLTLPTVNFADWVGQGGDLLYAGGGSGDARFVNI